MAATPCLLIVPDPGRLEAAFAPLAEQLGLRHGVVDSAALLLLVLLRFIAVTALCPFLGGRLVPGSVRIGLAMLMAWFSTPWLGGQLAAPLAMSAAGFGLAALHELGIGLVLGFGSSLVFFAVGMGGELLDHVRGALTANLLVPQLRIQASFLGDFHFQFFLVLYLIGGWHILFLSALFDSLRLFPPFGAMPAAALVHASFLRLTLGLFAIMVKVAAPALIVLLMVDLVLGVANRLAPQLDVFFIGLGLKPTLGLLLLAFSLYALASASPEIFRAFHFATTRWLRHG